MNKNYILLVFEGKKTEPEIFNNLTQHYLNEQSNTLVYGIYGSHIYSLFHKIYNDTDLDLFLLLQENNEELKGITKEQVSEIHLFFDYDGHDPTAEDDKVELMLDMFSEETEYGKLYISYPMIEAIKHLKCDVDFKDTIMEVGNGCDYKSHVHENSDSQYQSLANISIENWKLLIKAHLKKLGFLINDNYTIPETIIEQMTIFLKQKEKHIDSSNQVAVLSSIPIFLADYYGYEEIKKRISS